MQNIRNRSVITDARILSLIQECVAATNKMGFTVPKNLRFLECKASRRAGLACYRDTTIVLSTFIYKEDDLAVKSIILHEIGHIVAGAYAHHGPAWQRVVSKMTTVTGIKITRCYTDSDMPIHAEERKASWKYNFRCTGCGCELHYMRRTEFCDTYKDKLYNGKYRWTCTRCGGHFEKIK